MSNSKLPTQGWTTAYWDILEQVYWTPSYTGLKSVPRKIWATEGDRISIPAEMTSDNGPLYYRARGTNDYWPFIQRQEETFNHQLELLNAILAPEDLAHVWRPFCGFGDSVELTSLGRSTQDVLGWAHLNNIGQLDSFLVGSNAVAMIELKFNAKTSLDQFGKYIAFAARHAEVHGMRHFVSMTYVIAGEDPNALATKQLGFAPSQVQAIDEVELAQGVKNKAMRSYLLEHQSLVRSILDRVQMYAISWTDLHARLIELASASSDDNGGRTYARLLNGVAEAISLHPRSQVSSNLP